MRRLEKLDWSRNAHLHNVMLGLPNPHRFWQTGKADVSAEWWLRNSGDNRRATFLFSASFQQLLLLHCGLAGACGCGAGASSQEQSQCSAVNISYHCTISSMDFTDWQMQRLEPDSACSLLDHLWVHSSPSKGRWERPSLLHFCMNWSCSKYLCSI